MSKVIKKHSRPDFPRKIKQKEKQPETSMNVSPSAINLRTGILVDSKGFSGTRRRRESIANDPTKSLKRLKPSIKRNFSASHFTSTPVTVKSSHFHSNSTGENETEKTVDEHQLAAYSEIFTDIIEQDSVYGKMLAKVKRTYDGYIKAMKQAEQKKPPQQNLLQSKQQTNQKLKQENSDLLKEKKALKEEIRSLNKEMKSVKIREAKYMKLISLIKNQGFPVQEVYNKHVKRSKIPKIPSIQASTMSTPKESEVSSGKTLDSQSKVPPLSSIVHSNFHQEFMANFDEFSESWRTQIKIQKRQQPQLLQIPYRISVGSTIDSDSELSKIGAPEVGIGSIQEGSIYKSGGFGSRFGSFLLDPHVDTPESGRDSSSPYSDAVGKEKCQVLANLVGGGVLLTSGGFAGQFSQTFMDSKWRFAD